ncbi:DUF692 domain-containing protein [Pseudoalteromonas sp. 20-92]|uniref:MNIO family bufferin maturase n=1 Tax=Pseudoalteromonas sp. 20-92 TaxID=2969394 RepID=UPI0027B5FC4F|nr:DUF692 domain-containing protein [Pseudoalteromonas sp. 20-92]MDQ2045564.1 DUF692 domain-containing protein [Pseudoalteromonas sp. 20-92]
MTKNMLNLEPLGFGVGLRTQHFPYLMNEKDWGIDWFEIISENFIDNYGYARHVLEEIRAKKPIVMHGVSMNIGSTDPLNQVYLEKLKKLAHEIEPEWISDHLCWTGTMGVNSHDLLPMPLTKESFQHVVSRIHYVQDFLQRPLILENPSSYLEFQQNTFTEWDFLSELVNQTDCGLLLDVNNVYVSSYNHGYDPETFIKNLPHDHIVQIHLAGPTLMGDCLIDTHDRPVPEKVWYLYRLAQSLAGGNIATLLEWDANIPDFPTLVTELNKARSVLRGAMPSTDNIFSTINDTIALSTPIVR